MFKTRRRPRKMPWCRGHCCPASPWPPFRAQDPCWREDPPRDWSGLGWGPIFASPFLGALGSSCRKGMLTICWCSKLAPYPGKGRSVPEPSKDVGEGCAPHARSFLCPNWRVAFRGAPGSSGKRCIPGRPQPGGPHLRHLPPAPAEGPR